MSGSHSDPSEAALSSTERAVLGLGTTAAVRSVLDAYLHDRLGARIARVRFRSGRIDSVWGVDLDDGRSVAIKAHRSPADLDALSAARDAKVILARASFPVAMPLSGPDPFGPHVLSVDALLDGETPEGQDPAVRRLLATGLAEHIELLRPHPTLLARVGLGPPWCRYQGGPWPASHDALVDLRATPPEYVWLSGSARRASSQILRSRSESEVVVAHADWWTGNMLVRGGRPSGFLDWELVADSDAVIAGRSAAAFSSLALDSESEGATAQDGAEAFLEDYALARGRPLTRAERRAAFSSMAWQIAFDARWQVALLPHGLADPAEIERARERLPRYLRIGSGRA